MTQRKATVIVGYQVDSNSAQTAVLSNTKVLDSIKGVGAGAQSVAEQLAAMGVSLNDITVGGDQITTGLTDPLKDTDATVKTLIRDLGDLGNDLRSLPEPDLSTFGVAENTVGGGTNPLNSLRQGAGRATSLLALSGIGGQTGSVIAGSLGLIETFGPLAAVAAPAALAIKAVTEAEEARTKAAQDGADALSKIAEGAAGATSESINKQIAQQTEYKKNLEDAGKQLGDYQNSIQQTSEAYKQGLISSDEYTAVLKLIGRDVSNLTGGAVDAGQAVSNISAIIADNQKNVDSASVSIAGLNIQLHSSSVQANDAANELARYQAANQDLTDQLVKYQVDQANAAAQAQQLTQPQRAEKIRQDLEEQAVIQQQLASGHLLQGAHDKLILQYNALTDEVTLLSGVTNTYADQLLVEDGAKQALIDTEKQLLDNLTDQTKARAEIAQTEADIAQIRQDAAEKAAQAAGDRADKLAQADADANDKVAQIRLDGAEKLEQIEQDGASKRAQILEKFNIDYSNSVYQRDALAAYKAKQQRDKDLADQDAADKKAKDQLDKTIQKQLDAVQTALDKQKRSIEKSYQDQLRTIEDGERKQLAAKNLVLQQEQKALNDLIVSAGLFSQAVQQAQARVSALAGTPAPPIQTGSTGGSTGSNQVPLSPNIGDTWTDSTGKMWLWNGHAWQPAFAVKQYATGGVAQGFAVVNERGMESGLGLNSGEFRYFGEPTRIFSAPDTQRLLTGGGNGLNITVPIYGSQLTKRQIRDVVDSQVDKTLSDAGWD